MTDAEKVNENQPEWMKPGYWENRPWEERLEEYGELHGENCSSNMEHPDECDCSDMKQIKSFVRGELLKKDTLYESKIKELEAKIARMEQESFFSDPLSDGMGIGISPDMND